MKRIKFTEEHKTKLLEMCKKLFPEDVYSFNNDDGEDGIIDRNFAGDNIPYDKKLSWKDEGSHFHWFEFCIIYIFPKLFQAYSSKNLSNFYYDFLMHFHFNMKKYANGKLCYHPIDYLYEEFKFKKLKL